MESRWKDTGDIYERKNWLQGQDFDQTDTDWQTYSKGKRVKFSLELATKAQRGNRIIDLLFL
jgi:hypothetical protein